MSFIGRKRDAEIRSSDVSTLRSLEVINQNSRTMILIACFDALLRHLDFLDHEIEASNGRLGRPMEFEKVSGGGCQDADGVKR
jgi:hypothetical protein